MEEDFKLDLNHPMNDDFMQYVDMGDDMGSEFELSEDGASSMVSSADIKLEDLDSVGMPQYSAQYQNEQFPLYDANPVASSSNCFAHNSRGRTNNEFGYDNFNSEADLGSWLNLDDPALSQLPQRSTNSEETPQHISQRVPAPFSQHMQQSQQPSLQTPQQQAFQQQLHQQQLLQKHAMAQNIPQDPHGQMRSTSPQPLFQQPQPNGKLGSMYQGGDTKAQDLSQLLQFGAQEDARAAEIPPLETSKTSLDDIRREIDDQELEYEIEVRDFPARSRVETQIRCRIEIRHVKGNKDPDSERKLLLHLPTDSIARPKFQLLDPEQTHKDPRVSPHTLWLSVDAINPNHPEEQILMCSKCLSRERRRAFRRKTMDPHEETYWNKLEERRIIIFNCKEVMPLGAEGFVELPLRMACYCRHHAAKNGFNVVFTLRNLEGRVIGRGISSSVFITDSHKDHSSSATTTHGGATQTYSHAGHANHAAQSRLTSKPSVSSLSSVSSNSSASLQSGFDSLNSQNSLNHHQNSLHHRAGSSGGPMIKGSHPYLRPPSAQSSSSYGGNEIGNQLNRQIQTSQSVPMWVANVQQDEYLDPGMHAPMNAAGVSAAMSPSPGASPAFLGAGTNPAAGRMQVPLVFRAIPPSGSMRGGIDVTLLGQNLHSGLVVLFGDVPAISTQCWSDSTIIAQLPPSSQPGPVPITFQNVPVDLSVSPPPTTFTYINDGDDKLKEIALQMIGYKSTGQFDDAANIAQRILDGNHQGDGASHGSSAGGLSNGAVDRSSSGAADSGSPLDPADSERFTLWVLNNIHKLNGHSSTNVNLRNAEGQTMLHLAAMLGYASIVKAVLRLGAYIDSQDVSGFSPLHFAVLFGNRHITRMLLAADADPFHRTRNGFTALDIADSTVQDLLPTDQRAWYSELNRRGSSSSLASWVQEWHDESNAAARAAAAAAAASAAAVNANRAANRAISRSISPSSVAIEDAAELSSNSESAVSEDEPLTNAHSPPPYSQLFPTESGHLRRRKVSNKLQPKSPGSKVIDIEVSEDDGDGILALDPMVTTGTVNNAISNGDAGAGADVGSETLVTTQKRPGFTTRWRNRYTYYKHEISNDRMLLTFWIPLSMATILGICCVYMMQHYGSVNSHPVANAVGDKVKNWIIMAVNTILPMQQQRQVPSGGRPPSHHARS